MLQISQRMALLAAIASGTILMSPATEAAVQVGSSTWFWQDPLPQGNSLNAVSCPSLSDCFAVGDLGTILATFDAHTINPTFNGQSSPTNQTLRAISCPSTATCVAVGDNGTVLTTTNGGSSWTLQAQVGTFLGVFVPTPLRGISCPSTTQCFAMGGVNAVFMSSNTGVSWSLIPFGQLGNSLDAISCPSVFVCYAVGNLGQDFNAQVLKVFFSFNCSCFTTATLSTPDLSTNFLVAISCSSTNDCVAVDLKGNDIFTADGGSAWSLAVVDPRASLHAVSCVSGTNNCTAVGDGPNRIFVSITGGSSWLVLPANEPFRQPLNGVSCQNFGSGACVAVGFDGAIVGNPSSGIPHSIEGYATTNNPVNLSRVSCPTLGNCFAVGAGQILASISNGPWTQKLSETGNNLAGISCPSSTTCYVVGNPVLGTTNGGSSWVSLPTGSSAFLGEISCPSTTTCFAAGTSILATTSSGATWINQANPNFPVLGISCASTTSCVAVGVHGEILTTSDGMHWTDRSIATMTNDLHDVNCPTTSNCFAVGNSSTILATTNGGTSWSFQTVQSGHDFSSVGCLPSTTRCEVGTFQGEIFVGSGTWTKEAAIDPIYAVQGVSCMGGLLAFHCAAVGTIGTIVSKDFVFRILGTGELTPKGGSSEVGDPTTFTFTWTVPSGKSWRDLESLDFRLSDDDGIGLWARFLVGNPSAFALLDANGNIIAEGVPGGAGVLDSPTATLDLAKSSFQGTGPTGPSVTVTFVVSFKPPASGEHSARVYDTEISATDQTGRVQTPETVGHWVVRPADH